MENTTPSTSTDAQMQPVPQTNSPSLKIATTVLIILLPLVGIGGYVLGKQSVADERLEVADTVPSERSVVATDRPVTASPIPVSPVENMYQNTDYKISFILNEGERVVECPNVNEYNDNIALWIVNTPLPEGLTAETECATEGPFNAVFMSRKSAGSQTIQAYIQSMESSDNGFTLTKTPITISGISGMHIKGPRDTRIASPLPDSLDQMLFERDGAFISSHAHIQKEVLPL